MKEKGKVLWTWINLVFAATLSSGVGSAFLVVLTIVCFIGTIGSKGIKADVVLPVIVLIVDIIGALFVLAGVAGDYNFEFDFMSRDRMIKSAYWQTLGAVVFVSIFFLGASWLLFHTSLREILFN